MTVMPVAPAFLRLRNLSEVDESSRKRLTTQLQDAKLANSRQEEYYEGRRALVDLGIAIPPHLKDIGAAVGIPETVVDVIAEKLRWRGWAAPPSLAMDAIYRQNRLRVESSQATLDALIFGLSYMTVGTGGPGEPDVLVMPQSPNRMTATWSPRLRRVTEALAELYDDATGALIGWNLYRPGETVRIEIRNNVLAVVDRDQHGLPRVPVAVLRNRPRGDRRDGRSEITRVVRYYTDNAIRTILGMEVSREFYGAPQRYMLGADEALFVDESGNPRGQWAAVIGKMLVAPRDEQGEVPEVGQFNSASPQPFTDVLRTVMQLVSSATGIPAHHLGFTTDNPASEGAIARADDRLNQRTIDRQDQYDLGLIELGELALLWRDGEIPDDLDLRSVWTHPGVVTPGAAADRAGKMIASGVIAADSDFALEAYGLSDDEILRVRQGERRSGGSAALRAIAEAASAGVPAVTAAGDNNADDASA